MNPKFAIIVSSIFIITFSLWESKKLERHFYKINFQLRGEVSSNPNIVNIVIKDQEFFKGITNKQKLSFNATTKKITGDLFHNTFYWDTDFYIRLLQKIKRYSPLLIVVLPNFPSVNNKFPFHSLNKKEINKLKKLTSSIPVLWSSTLTTSNTLLSPPKFLTQNNIFYNNLFFDEDFYVRKAQLKNNYVYSLAGIVWNHPKVKARFKKSKLININFNKSFYICFTANPIEHNSISAHEFLLNPDDMGWAPTINNKIVFIYLDAPHNDKFLVPYSSNYETGLVSNINVQNHILDSLIRGHAIHKVPYCVNVIISLFLGLILLLIFLKKDFVSALLFSSCITIVFLILNFSFFTVTSTWLNIASPLLVMLLTVIVMGIWRYTLEEHLKALQVQHELEELKGNFLSLISHNLKTPVAKVRALSSVILNKDPSNLRHEQKEALSNILKSSKELTRYIGNILNLTRIEAKRIKLNKTICDINELIKQAVERIKSVMEHKHVNFIFELDPIFSVELDQELFYQILLNLVENALKYSPDKSSITITSKEHDNMIEISISDQGIGIRKEELAKIFNKFHRSLTAYTESISGTGLGLYLVKYFVELHGGSIRVASTLGQGSTFTIELPIA